jgi:hypothetical protein
MCEGFLYLHSKFSNLIYVKVKEGIVVGSQIMKVTFDKNFERKVNITESAAWKSFKSLFRGCLSN